MNLALRSCMALLAGLAGLAGFAFTSASLANAPPNPYATAAVQERAPGRAGRLAGFEGQVSMFEPEDGQWQPALRNRPLSSGDRIATGPDGRATVRVGSTSLWLGPLSELELVRVDDEQLHFQLHSGNAALRVRSSEKARELAFYTEEARLMPQRAGLYRIDRQDDVTSATTIRGELMLDDSGAFPISPGLRYELWREGARDQPRGLLRHRATALPQDAFAQWMAREDAREERSVSQRYVSPEMTGVEDLDEYGRWERHPSYGAVWVPLAITAGWAPYQMGRWVWVRPWGWTWVDQMPWGFAPFHYGRWEMIRGRWCWIPGAYVARPVFSPGLVAWVGSPSVSIGVTIGGRGRPLPGSTWVPLRPHEPYRPWGGPGAAPRYSPPPPAPHAPHVPQRPHWTSGPAPAAPNGQPVQPPRWQGGPPPREEGSSPYPPRPDRSHRPDHPRPEPSRTWSTAPAPALPPVSPPAAAPVAEPRPMPPTAPMPGVAVPGALPMPAVSPPTLRPAPVPQPPSPAPAMAPPTPPGPGWGVPGRAAPRPLEQGTPQVMPGQPAPAMPPPPVVRERPRDEPARAQPEDRRVRPPEARPGRDGNRERDREHER